VGYVSLFNIISIVILTLSLSLSLGKNVNFSASNICKRFQKTKKSNKQKLRRNRGESNGGNGGNGTRSNYTHSIIPTLVTDSDDGSDDDVNNDGTGNYQDSVQI